MNENLDPSSNSLSSDEHEFEQTLRPLSFADFTGQDHILENLKIFTLCFDITNQFQKKVGNFFEFCGLHTISKL